MLKEACERMPADSCECAQLLESVLLPRLRHWKCARDLTSTYKYLLEIAAAYVYLQNDAKVCVCVYLHLNKCITVIFWLQPSQFVSYVLQALEYLTEAMSILESSLIINRGEQAFVHRLTGEVRLRFTYKAQM